VDFYVSSEANDKYSVKRQVVSKCIHYKYFVFFALNTLLVNNYKADYDVCFYVLLTT